METPYTRSASTGVVIHNMYKIVVPSKDLAQLVTIV